MSKERARRRAARLAEGAARREATERANARRARWARRRAAMRPAVLDRRTGRLYLRRTKAQRAVIVAGALGALAAVWWFLDSLPLKIAATAVIVIAAPALIVVAFDRRT